MGSKATTIAQQISQLQQRGMNLDIGIDKTKEVLLDIGYYRLGFYWNPFEKDKHHNFHTDTKMSDVLDLYYLDVDLRNVLSRYLKRIEINFRTKVIYFCSNEYSHNPQWFIDSSIMNEDFVESFPKKIYNWKFKEYNEVIKKHHKKYGNKGYAPAWKTLEFLSFGTILKMFRAIKEESLQKMIAMQYDIRKEYIFINHLTVFTLVRNICAHGGTLFDFRAPKGISFVPALLLDKKDRHSLNAIITLVSYYLGKVSTNRKSDFDNEIETLMISNRFSPIIKSIIETKINYKSV